MAQQMPAPAKIRALIVDGVSNHDWRKTTDFIKATLADTGIFEVEVTTTPGDSADPAWDRWRPAFSGFGVVIINWNTDLGDAWEWAEDPYYPLKYSTYAIQMGVNFIIYAMSH